MHNVWLGIGLHDWMKEWQLQMIFLLFSVYSVFTFHPRFSSIRFTLNRFGTFVIEVLLLHFNFCLCLLRTKLNFLGLKTNLKISFGSDIFSSPFHFHEKSPPKETDLSCFMLFDTWQRPLHYYSNIQIICSTRYHRIFSHFPKSKFAFWDARCGTHRFRYKYFNDKLYNEAFSLP